MAPVYRRRVSDDELMTRVKLKKKRRRRKKKEFFRFRAQHKNCVRGEVCVHATYVPIVADLAPSRPSSPEEEDDDLTQEAPSTSGARYV